MPPTHYARLSPLHPVLEISARVLLRLNDIRRLTCGSFTPRQDHSPSNAADNLQCVSDQVLPRFWRPAGETDVHECAYDADKHAVHDKPRLNPPSEPDSKCERGNKR